MSKGCDERAMKRKTEGYWDSLRSNFGNPIPVWREYVENLLPEEMACMEAGGRLPKKSCQALVLLVGQSVEPLLQSVWAYRLLSLRVI